MNAPTRDEMDIACEVRDVWGTSVSGRPTMSIDTALGVTRLVRRMTDEQIRGRAVTVPTLPSWQWDANAQALTLWRTGIHPGPDATLVTGPLAERLWDCLSWIDAQTRLPDPEPEPEGPSSADLREWAQESRAVADAALRLANAIAWEADR